MVVPSRLPPIASSTETAIPSTSSIRAIDSPGFPKPDPRSRTTGARIRLEGEVADPASPPPGCYFHPRCRYAKPECAAREPELRDAGGGHVVACHRAGELTLKGRG